MNSGRGGKRENAGRKTGWSSGRGFDKTKIIRVPIEFAEQLLQIAHKLDAGEILDSVTKTEPELNPDLLLAEELVTKSVRMSAVDLVTESKQEISSDLPLVKELVTKSIERAIIDSVKDILFEWRQKSDQAKINSPKSERWAKARQMLDELEPVILGATLLPEEVRTADFKEGEADSVAAIEFDPIPLQNNLVTESNNDKSGDLVTESINIDTEAIELVTKTEPLVLEENVVESPNQLNLLNQVEYQANNSKTETKELTSLTRVELAERFGIKVGSLENRATGKMAPTFPEWSQKKDPDGITWRYYPETKLFFPVIETVTNLEVEAASENRDTPR